jgi:hypothetical protein
MATKLIVATAQSKGAVVGVFNVLKPIRSTACITMAATAGLMPYSTPTTHGTLPKAT